MKMWLTWIGISIWPGLLGAQTSLPPTQWPPFPGNGQNILDARGFSWQIGYQGSLQRTSNHGMHNSMTLRVQGSNFQQTNAFVSPDALQYRFEGNAGGVPLERWVKIDRDQGLLRYLDIFENPSTTPQEILVEYRLNFNGRISTLLSDRAAVLTGDSLQSREIGFVVEVQGRQGLPLVGVHAVRSRPQYSPLIRNRGGNFITMEYKVNLPASGKAALLIGLIQEAAGTPRDESALRQMFQPFGHREWLEDIPREHRTLIVNNRSLLNPSEINHLLKTPENSTSDDILIIGTNSRLSGRVIVEEPVLVREQKSFPLNWTQVAAVLGPRATGGPTFVHFRDGQVWAGTLQARHLAFALAGASVKPTPLLTDKLDRLVLAGSADEPRTTALIETTEGERLAFVPQSGSSLALSTRWGNLSVPMSQIAALAPQDEGEAPGLVVLLHDGSRFPATAGDFQLTWDAPTLGRQTLEASRIRSLTLPRSHGTLPDWEDNPHILLGDQAVLVGHLQNPSLQFDLDGQPITIETPSIRVLRNISSESPTAGAPVFEVELWTGGKMRGTLADKEVNIRFNNGQLQLRVQTSEVNELRNPSPLITPDARERAARLVRDLGSPNWSQREEATRQLSAMGVPALEVLRDAVRNSRDAEVVRRARSIIQQIEGRP